MRTGSLLLALLCLFSTNALAADRYVNATNPSPVAPFIAWGNAARTIQDAVDVSVAGDVIWVAAGTYSNGGRVMVGSMTNRVAVTVPVTVRSVSGPAVTVIAGVADPSWSYVLGCGSSAVRCVYLTNGASLIGFTLTNGNTLTTGDIQKERSAGGVYCEGNSVTISNCVIVNCGGYQAAGGGAAGTYRNCTIKNNKAWNGGGVYVGVLQDCTVAGNWAGSEGAGLFSCIVQRCTVVSNTCGSTGGGMTACQADRCLIQGNSASQVGGGCSRGSVSNSLVIQNAAPGWRGGGGYQTEFVNCTLVANTAPDSGGAFTSVLINCIAYYNTGTTVNANIDPLSSVTYSCVPGMAGAGNISAAPQFLAGSYRLQPSSPCIDKGTNLPSLLAAKDLDGRPRIEGSNVDLGAYEFSGSVVNDYNANGQSDFPVFNPADGSWYISSTNRSIITWTNQWGWSTVKPVPGDYDGDGTWDLAVFDSVGGNWYIRRVDGTVIVSPAQWGWGSVKPVPGDYDGDGIWDLAVFDPAGGNWYIRRVDGSVIASPIQWGWSTVKPVSGDYDGDGKYDLAVFDPVGGNWYIRRVDGTVIASPVQWGWTTAKPVPGDYDGDGKFDLAVYDTAAGYWYVKTVDNRIRVWQAQWGWPGATIPTLEAAQ